MRIRFLSVFVAIVAALTLAAAAQTGPAQTLLEAAKKKDVVDGDVKGAIQQYQLVVDRYAKTDRAAAAQALVRMAECYQKIGDAHAQNIYARVVAEYPDQKDAVTVARARLEVAGPAAADTGGPRIEPVWRGRGVSIGAVTGDRPLLAHIDSDTGNLAVRDLSAGRTLLLTRDGNWETTWAEASVASDDGRYVAYEWYDNAKGRASLRLIGSSGDATPRVLYDNPDIWSPAPLDWSFDGQNLAVRFRRNDRTTQIGVVRVADGSVRILKSLNWTGQNAIQFSPDSRYLAYDLRNAETSAEQHVFVMSLDGAREVAVTPNSGDYRLVGWTADGSRIVFTSGQMGTRSLWAVPVRDGRPDGSPELLKSDFNATPLGLSRSGTLYYSILAGGPDIYTASFDSVSGRLTSVPSRPFQPAGGARNGGDWSADGRYLAYFSHSGVNDDPKILLIKDMTTGQVRQVPYSLPYVNAHFTRWTPDGRAILTFGRDLKGRQGVFRINIATGETASVVFSDTCRGATQTTDGTGLFCVSADQATISRFDIALGSQRELVSGHTLEILGGSPDGKYLAFTEKHTDTKATSLKLLTLASGEQKELLSVEAPDSIFFHTFAWTPDSQSVVFQKQRPGRSSLEMWFASIDGRARHKIDMPVTASAVWRFNPKTNQVAFGVGTSLEFEVWKIEKFLKSGSH